MLTAIVHAVYSYPVGLVGVYDVHCNFILRVVSCQCHSTMFVATSYAHAVGHVVLFTCCKVALCSYSVMSVFVAMRMDTLYVDLVVLVDVYYVYEHILLMISWFDNNRDNVHGTDLILSQLV